MLDRLREAIQLRSTRKAEEAIIILLDLVASYPDDPDINYQAAWVHDDLGLAREAIPFYIKAIENGLLEADLEGALLGLSSSYRALGEYQKAMETLQRGVMDFPENRAFQIFLAMVLYNTHHYSEAMELLLQNLAHTTSDRSLLHYKRAILFYASRLDHVWE